MVGNGCAPAGAACVNVETSTQDKESAKRFSIPGTCAAQNKMLNFKQASTSWHIMTGSWDVVLLITSTNAALSMKKMIR